MKGQRRRLHNARRVGKKTEKTKFIKAEVKVHFYKMKTNKILELLELLSDYDQKAPEECQE